MGALIPKLLVAFLLLSVGCKQSADRESGEENNSGLKSQSSGNAWCESPEALSERRGLVAAAGLQLQRTEWEGDTELGELFEADGYTIRAVRWDHPWGENQAFGVWVTPDPIPDGPLPLLVNVHGHWDAGVESGEVLFRSELFARQGWAVLSVATRGAEQGDGEGLAWRAAHFDAGLYGEVRERSFGRTPLGWNVEAASRGLDLALEGRFGNGPIDRDRVGVIGASGGAEIAAALGAIEPRVRASVLGAFEYAFGSQEGSSSCSCGVLRGGGEASQSAAWLALGACRFGRQSTVRPTLLWEGQPESGRSERLLALGPAVERRLVPGVHGFNPSMAAASWAWMDAVLLDGEATGADEDVARAATQAAWQHVPPSMRPTWPSGLAGVGLVPGAKRPWETPFTVETGRVRSVLGLGTAAELTDPGEGWVGPLDVESIRIERPRATADGRAWVVVLGRGPSHQTAEGAEIKGPPPVGFEAREAVLDGLPHKALQGLDGKAALGFLVPRTEEDPQRDSTLTRWGLELGVPPLGLAVHDVMTAVDQLSALPEVSPEKVGLIGVGSGGPAALWAARLLGGESPVLLVHAPVTLGWDGPRSGDAEVPLRPWPTSLIVADRFGASLDPWMALSDLEGRLRWLDPRGGDAQPWSGTHPLPGRKVENLKEGLRVGP